jgi:hypothetical protein
VVPLRVCRYPRSFFSSPIRSDYPSHPASKRALLFCRSGLFQSLLASCWLSSLIFAGVLNTIQAPLLVPLSLPPLFSLPSNFFQCPAFWFQRSSIHQEIIGSANPPKPEAQKPGKPRNPAGQHHTDLPSASASLKILADNSKQHHWEESTAAGPFRSHRGTVWIARLEAQHCYFRLSVLLAFHTSNYWGIENPSRSPLRSRSPSHPRPQAPASLILNRPLGFFACHQLFFFTRATQKPLHT